MNSNNMKPNEGHHTGKRQKINACSALLTPEENEAVIKMLGWKCQTLNTAVVQIYKTEGSAHSHWKKKHTGVVCFVKDSDKRSYFLRAYCLIQNKLIWEHEIYDAMKIVKARPFLLSFEGQDGHVGLNFVSEEECDSFFMAVDTTLDARNRKRQEKRSRPPIREAINPVIGQSAARDSNTAVQLRNNLKINSVTTTTTTPTTMTSTSPASKNFLSSVGFSSSSKDKKRKVTKADISQPTNFVHISHVGWDANKGFDLTGDENDEHLSQIFAKAGVSETELRDRDTRAFIYDFIQRNKPPIENAKTERIEKPKAAAPPAPPPVPSRHHHHHNQHQTQNGAISTATATVNNTGSQRTAPPPPPARQPPPPIPNSPLKSGGSSSYSPCGGTPAPREAAAAREAATRAAPPLARPPPPPPLLGGAAAQPTAAITATIAAPPPPPPAPPQAAIPPPPPPMPTITATTMAPSENKPASTLPVVTDSRCALMDSIRKGTTLRKVDVSGHSTGSGDSRSELMSEIRMGIELRPAQHRELGSTNRSSDDGTGTDALADALRRALQERGRVIQSSDEESESSGNDDEWDD